MRYSKKNLEDLESSINALHKKASNINDAIKNRGIFSDKMESLLLNLCSKKKLKYVFQGHITRIS